MKHIPAAFGLPLLCVLALALSTNNSLSQQPVKYRCVPMNCPVSEQGFPDDNPTVTVNCNLLPDLEMFLHCTVSSFGTCAEFDPNVQPFKVCRGTYLPPGDFQIIKGCHIDYARCVPQVDFE